VAERVLLVLASSAGGVGRHVASLAAGLRARGHDVTVAGPAATGEVFAFPSFEVVEIGARPHPRRDLVAVHRLRRLAGDADVVHAHGLRAAALSVLTAGPVVVTLHNAVGGPVAALLERLVARRASVVLAAGEDLAARARALRAREVRLAPVAAPAPAPSGRDPGLGSPLVLAVGRLHPQKGYRTLIAAREAWPEAVVAVAGDGPLQEELAAAGPSIRWLGRREDVADLLAAADVVVLPSLWEARSLTAQEALRLGRPLVASAVGSLPALVRDGAVLVPPQDPAALAAAVRRLLDDPAEAAALAARGRAVAQTWPTEQDTVCQVAQVYQELRA
jgi:glycosyltransferase involved in cell wall biosynthesis